MVSRRTGKQGQTRIRKNNVLQKEIITRLAELPATPETKDLLHDLFFEFLLSETKDGLPEGARIRAIRNIRFEIMQMYALAEEARALVSEKLNG